MADRKFTPPTEFPAEYVDGCGRKAVILGLGPNEEFPFIGYNADGNAATWTEMGDYYSCEQSEGDLHDIPKRITTWHNVWPTFMSTDLESRGEADKSSRFSLTPRICVYRIERDEDGGNPEIFVEEV